MIIEKRILYIVASGPEAPQRAYMSLLLATTAMSEGNQTTVYFLDKGVNVLRKAEAEGLRLKGFPPLLEIVEQAVRSGVKLEACEESCMLAGVGPNDIIADARIVGAVSLNERLTEADATVSL